ncbi:MAG: hypothetical protein NT027_08290, partial [Proteobacteria bacterium]|nr:hypothetical protein [Pseudomonadota bacterium]
WWTRLTPIRTTSEVPIEFSVFVSEPFRYQEISIKVQDLQKLGMNCHQISEALGEEYKTIKRAIRWLESLNVQCKSDKVPDPL